MGSLSSMITDAEASRMLHEYSKQGESNDVPRLLLDRARMMGLAELAGASEWADGEADWADKVRGEARDILKGVGR